MATEQRPWPNNASYVRDDGAILVRQVIISLEQITKNKVNTEEEMESIAAEAVSDLNIFLRALEREGAKTSPENELKSRIDQFGTVMVMANA
jgi:hypothetical protein